MHLQVTQGSGRCLGIPRPCPRSARATSLRCRAEKETAPGKAKQEAEPGFGLKAIWTAAEKFGDALGRRKGQPVSSQPESLPQTRQMSRAEVIASLREDYNNNYFVSGTGSMEAYEPDCEFADPFASFRGTQRFKKNVGNLGGLAQNVKCDILDWRETEDSVATKWRFSAVLDLPWRPLLAAKGGTTHFLSKDTGRVEKHLEMWDTEPQRVLKTLLKPTAKVPTNQWETFFMALSVGDALGVWFAISSPALKGAAILFTDFFVFDLIRGKGLQGSLVGWGQEICYILALACVLTEGIKFAQGMQGGETGTGGRF
ncbi:hypothetical protein WJX84_001812 [Apatococcus fuscideae]|uniref:Uncharacterized protein n=1 Tax=Apatococcus fuscideae TaxID=2026836 RepID=A0AAW1T1D6_9CHLO